MTTYTAASLEDIAKMFDRNAEREERLAHHDERNQARKRIRKEAATVWQEAAAILRATTLTEKKFDCPAGIAEKHGKILP